MNNKNRISEGELSISSELNITPLDLTNFDPSKPTVCNITINSADERGNFYKHLGTEFNFIELVDETNPDWFEKACQSGIKCDILNISGHFGGTFFGSSAATLSTTELEQFACANICDNILKNPKEVFLFGCNTMAGKKPDARTQEEYTQVLIEDGLSRSQAELVSAYRYSPIGSRNQDRMQRVFSGSRIYGFHSKAPLGHKIVRRLDNYFNSIPSENYITHLASVLKTDENKLWTRAMKGQYIRSRNGSELIENPVCILQSDTPDYKKLSWVVEAFNSKEDTLKFIPNINSYIEKLEYRFGSNLDRWPKEEASYIERIQFNQAAKKEVLSLIKEPQLGILSVQFDLLEFTQRVGWLDQNEYESYRDRLINDLMKDNLDLELKDMICSTGLKLDLKLSDLPEETWNKYTINALACLETKNMDVQRKVIGYLGNADYLIKSAASYYFKSISPLKSEVIDLLLEKYNQSNELETKKFIISSIASTINENKKVAEFMVSNLINGAKEIAEEVRSSLHKVPVISESVINLIFTKSNDSKDVSNLVYFLTSLFSQKDSESKKELINKFSEYLDKEITISSIKSILNAIWVLRTSELPSEKIMDIAIKYLGESDFVPVLSNFIQNLYSIGDSNYFNSKLIKKLDEYDCCDASSVLGSLIWLRTSDRNLILALDRFYERFKFEPGFTIKNQYMMIMQTQGITDSKELEFFKENAPSSYQFLILAK